MKIGILLLLSSSLLVTGCASVNMAPKDASTQAKAFATPTANNAGLYIYRTGAFGGALKKDLFIDGKCIGETAPDVFFYTEVEGGKTHKIDTESEFSANTLNVAFDAGKNYFIRQYIKMGVFVHGAGLEQVTDVQGKAEIAKLELATPGHCSATK